MTWYQHIQTGFLTTSFKLLTTLCEVTKCYDLTLLPVIQKGNNGNLMVNSNHTGFASQRNNLLFL